MLLILQMAMLLGEAHALAGDLPPEEPVRSHSFWESEGLVYGMAGTGAAAGAELELGHEKDRWDFGIELDGLAANDGERDVRALLEIGYTPGILTYGIFGGAIQEDDAEYREGPDPVLGLSLSWDNNRSTELEAYVAEGMEHGALAGLSWSGSLDLGRRFSLEADLDLWASEDGDGDLDGFVAITYGLGRDFDIGLGVYADLEDVGVGVIFAIEL